MCGAEGLTQSGSRALHMSMEALCIRCCDVRQGLSLVRTLLFICSCSHLTAFKHFVAGDRKL